MAALMLNRHSQVRAFAGEGSFFEHIHALEDAPFLERKAEILHELTRADDPVLNDELQDVVRQRLDAVDENRSAEALYVEGKQALAECARATRWAQKATSYVFHVETILKSFPKATLLFMIRNPLDLAASLRRRGHWHSVGRMLWGWNAGVERALMFRQRYPESFKIVRYEDLVAQPEQETRDILAFCSLPYDAACLDVAHVNRSEQPYTQQSETSGLNTSRVFYYSHVLSAEEEVAIRLLTDERRFRVLYSDLPEPSADPSARCIYHAFKIAVLGLLETARDQAGVLLDDPSHAIRRIRKRLEGGV